MYIGQEPDFCFREDASDAVGCLTSVSRAAASLRYLRMVHCQISDVSVCISHKLYCDLPGTGAGQDYAGRQEISSDSCSCWAQRHVVLAQIWRLYLAKGQPSRDCKSFDI